MRDYVNGGYSAPVQDAPGLCRVLTEALAFMLCLVVLLLLYAALSAPA